MGRDEPQPRRCHIITNAPKVITPTTYVMRVWTTARQGQVRREVRRARGGGGGFGVVAAIVVSGGGGLAAIVLGGGGGLGVVVVAIRGLVELRVSN